MSWHRAATLLLTELVRVAETAEPWLNALVASTISVEISTLHCLGILLATVIAWHMLRQNAGASCCDTSRTSRTLSPDDRVRGFRLRVNSDTCVLFADPDRRRVREIITTAAGGGFEIDDDARVAVMRQSIQSGALGDRTCELVVDDGSAFEFDMPVERVLHESACALQVAHAWLNLQQNVQKTPP